jgi:NAD(P)-dependent dehydrogenase (short-subunit alcohol dehydrogenase family)
VAVNLDGAFLCTRRAVPLLKAAGGGAVVNISSTAGLMGYPLRTPYAAAKWGVIGLTRSLAIELGPSGIRVNAICPGSVEGARMARAIRAEAAVRGVGEEDVRQAYIRTTSLRCFVAPEDIAAMALFLCSDLGANISGQAIAVDGHTEGLSG